MFGDEAYFTITQPKLLKVRQIVCLEIIPRPFNVEVDFGGWQLEKFILVSFMLVILTGKEAIFATAGNFTLLNSA